MVKSVPVGKDPLKVVQKCLEKREEDASRGRGYDHCVCLVDVGSHQSLGQASTVAQHEGVGLLVSNVKFEVWLCWHVVNRNSRLGSAALDREVEQLGLIEDKRLSPAFPIEGVEVACERARNADPGLAPWPGWP